MKALLIFDVPRITSGFAQHLTKILLKLNELFSESFTLWSLKNISTLEGVTVLADNVLCEHSGVFFVFFVADWWQKSLQWRHNEHSGVSNVQPHDCLLNRLFRRRSKFPFHDVIMYIDAMMWILMWTLAPHYRSFARGIHLLTLYSLLNGSFIWMNLIFSPLLVWTSFRTNSRVFCDMRCHDAHVTSLWWRYG